MDLASYTVSDAITLPERTDCGIGVIGCGGIVNHAHLPAYRRAGFHVVACYDQNAESAHRTAQEHGIPQVAASVVEILHHPDIATVDIAVTPWAQAAIAKEALAAGKHVLCQKPLADTYASAVEVVDLAQAHGLELEVNQQMRWDAAIAVSRQLIDQGAIGIPADARIETSIRTPWHMWPWMAHSPRLEIMYHSIHYQDSLRYLCGDPVAVSSVHSRWPGQPETGETRTMMTFIYEDERRATIDVNHHNWSKDAYARFRFLGTEGIVEGTLGLLYDDPHRPRRHPPQRLARRAARLAQGDTLDMVDSRRLRRADGVAHEGNPDRR